MRVVLSEHLPLLATAPDGIQKLRGLILELAVRGKLVPQDPHDEPASELLKRIAKEKARLVIEGEVRKGQPLASVCEDDQQFGLADGWVWDRLGALAMLVTDGTHHTPTYIPSGIPFISVKDIDGSNVSFDDCRYISEDEHKQINLRCNPEQGDILLCRIGTLGRPTVVDTDIPFSLFVSVGLIKLPKSENISRYLHLVLSSPSLANQFDQIKAGGSHTNKLNLGDIPTLRIPVPPHAEQHRIVAKVDELMVLCDRLEAEQTDATSAHAKLVETLLSTLAQSRDADELATSWQRLSQHFDTLFSTEAGLDALKQTILQLAVMGKLVPQDANDEPASELLKRIAKEKERLVAEGRIRKNKPLAALDEIEEPFELPTGWVWARFPELGEFGRGKSKHRPRNDPALFNPGIYPLVQTGEVARAGTIVQQYHSKYSETGLSQSKMWPQGTLCITIAANIADSAILGFDACFPDIQKQLWGMFQYCFGGVLSLARVDRVRWHLFPEIRIQQGNLFDTAIVDAPDPNQSISKVLPDLVKIMDLEQEKVARNLGEGHLIIHGVAGSGKTLLLAYRCLHLSRQGLSKPILVLCFNKVLAARLKQLLAEKGVGDSVHVRHFHGWCKDMCSLYQLDLAKDSRPFYEKQVEAVIAGAEKGRVPRAQYAAVLIDEGHDFEPEWFKLLVQMIDPETNSLLLLYDDAQNIYGKRKRRKYSWASVGVDAKTRRAIILKVNYRNTVEALDFSYQFLTAYIDEASGTEEIPVVHPEYGGRNGAVPEIKRLPGNVEEAEYIAVWLKKRAAEGVPFRDMAVLGRFNTQLDRLRASLSAKGVPVVLADSKAPGDAVRLFTMHSSKGLEFNSVAIPDLGCMPCAKTSPEEEARLLYVALTRSTERLLVTYHNDSQFTKQIEQLRPAS